MLFVDYREGSKELIDPLLKRGLPVERSDMDSGDIAFIGRGEGGEPVWVGIEHKKMSDLIQSLRTGRLNEQAEKMQRDYRFRYLLIEGQLRFGPQGHVLRRVGRYRDDWKPMPGNMRIGELLKRLATLHLMTGLTPIWSETQANSLKHIEMLYRVWTDTDLDAHKSHMALHEPRTAIPISEQRAVLCRLPGVQLKTSGVALKKFKSVRRAMNGTVREWAELKTKDDKGGERRVGEKTAQRIVDFLTEEVK